MSAPETVVGAVSDLISSRVEPLQRELKKPTLLTKIAINLVIAFSSRETLIKPKTQTIWVKGMDDILN